MGRGPVLGGAVNGERAIVAVFRSGAPASPHQVNDPLVRVGARAFPHEVTWWRAIQTHSTLYT